MPESIRFGNIETALIAYLTAQFTSAGETATVHDQIPAKRPPKFVTVHRGGGPKRNLVTDSANVEFECYASPESAAYSLADLVRSRVDALQGQTISGIVVYRVEEFAGPARLPHTLSTTPRYVFTARIDFRGSAE